MVNGQHLCSATAMASSSCEWTVLHCWIPPASCGSCDRVKQPGSSPSPSSEPPVVYHAAALSGHVNILVQSTCWSIPAISPSASLGTHSRSQIAHPPHPSSHTRCKCLSSLSPPASLSLSTSSCLSLLSHLSSLPHRMLRACQGSQHSSSPTHMTVR